MVTATKLIDICRHIRFGRSLVINYKDRREYRMIFAMLSVGSLKLIPSVLHASVEIYYGGTKSLLLETISWWQSEISVRGKWIFVFHWMGNLFQVTKTNCNWHWCGGQRLRLNYGWYRLQIIDKWYQFLLTLIHWVLGKSEMCFWVERAALVLVICGPMTELY